MTIVALGKRTPEQLGNRIATAKQPIKTSYHLHSNALTTIQKPHSNPLATTHKTLIVAQNNSEHPSNQ